MTSAIKRLIESTGAIICPRCNEEGEFGYGYSTEHCYMCNSNGVVKSLKKVKHRKTCKICHGNGGKGCCEYRGYHEWETFELIV